MITAISRLYKSKGDLVKRYNGNPIITAADVPNPCNAVFNPGVTIYRGEYILLVRVDGLKGRSDFYLARSKDGIDYKLSKDPVLTTGSEEPFKTYEERGVEDPRITRIEGTYYILYTAFSKFGTRIALASTQDFKTFKKIALISEPENKDAVLFPKKFGRRYARLDRPSEGNIWISYSNDLYYWGDSKAVMGTRPGYWDKDKVGAGAPPIETEEGWLLIYHGVKYKVYRLGCALLDIDDPSRLIGRSEAPMLSPRMPYERTGDVPNVVFTCGAVLERNGGVKIYYGAADTCICLCTVSIDELVESCLIGEK